MATGTIDERGQLGVPSGGLEVVPHGQTQVFFFADAGDGREQVELFADLSRDAGHLLQGGTTSTAIFARNEARVEHLREVRLDGSRGAR